MGKQGPCSHCGVTSTPLWRNGPPEKPVLCNACGSRWRTKGSLVNYTPLHARSEPNSLDYSRLLKAKATANVKTKEAKVLKRKPDSDVASASEVVNLGFSKVFDEETGNRSSSGSAISNSESFVHDGNADASEWTGPSQPVVWDSAVPSRKRTCVARAKPSSVEKLTKDLYTIWQEQQQSSCLSGFSEEDVLLETAKPMVSVEIGHGSVLIKHPNSIAQAEESVASSLSFETKQDTVSSMQMVFAAPVANAGVDSSNGEMKKTRRDKDQLGELQILNHHDSQLRDIYSQDYESHNVGAGLIGVGAKHSFDMKSPRGSQPHKHKGENVVVRNPSGSNMNLPRDRKEFSVKNGDISSSDRLFPCQDDNGCPVNEDSYFADEISDQDLLLDVPSNGSFPQAELLIPTPRAMF